MTAELFMRVGARRAAAADLGELLRMYGELAEEQRSIRPIWPYADGLAEPVETALGHLLDRRDAVVVVGEIDRVVVGFLVGLEKPLLAPLADQHIGAVELIFTDHEARGVGVGAAMLSVALECFEERGIDRFDARVSPGHRMAKNFFESNGFKARSITMHRSGAADVADHEARP
jgi:GNAT superfamily N-acetyltransferase